MMALLKKKKDNEKPLKKLPLKQIERSMLKEEEEEKAEKEKSVASRKGKF